jgi:gamma-glutamyltranspeptidase/glutathione hydrolase
MNIQDAINAPRIHHQWQPDKIFFEKFSINNDAMENLLIMGHTFSDMLDKFKILGLTQGIMIDDNVIYGASDPRGSGSAEGY